MSVTYTVRFLELPRAKGQVDFHVDGVGLDTIEEDPSVSGAALFAVKSLLSVLIFIIVSFIGLGAVFAFARTEFDGKVSVHGLWDAIPRRACRPKMCR